MSILTRCILSSVPALFVVGITCVGIANALVPKDSVELRWNAVVANLAAKQALSQGKPFIYVSGGMFCSPVVKELDDLALSELFPYKAIACGCLVPRSELALAQLKYAAVFNAEILKQVREDSYDETKQAQFEQHPKPHR